MAQAGWCVNSIADYTPGNLGCINTAAATGPITGPVAYDAAVLTKVPTV
jgi:hypothetical protein